MNTRRWVKITLHNIKIPTIGLNKNKVKTSYPYTDNQNDILNDSPYTYIAALTHTPQMMKHIFHPNLGRKFAAMFWCKSAKTIAHSLPITPTIMTWRTWKIILVYSLAFTLRLTSGCQRTCSVVQKPPVNLKTVPSDKRKMTQLESLPISSTPMPWQIRALVHSPTVPSKLMTKTQKKLISSIALTALLI